MQVGTGFGALGIVFTMIGIIRGNVPPHPLNIAVALLIGGGVWFFVSWAVAAAVYEVESDEEEESEVTSHEAPKLTHDS